MPEPIRFYFDFISPYGYFAAHRLEAIADKHGRTIDWRPFNMRSLIANRLKISEPIFQQPIKGAYFRRDVPRTARYFGLPYDPANIATFNPTRAERAVWTLKEINERLAGDFTKAAYTRIFAEKSPVETPGDIAGLGEALGVDGAALAASADSPVLKERLKAETDAAAEAGVWGTPTFVVDGEMFWGSDRMGMLDEWLQRGGW
jgi:2-hydroxychromene-2-carboxylate isomerase